MNDVIPYDAVIANLGSYEVIVIQCVYKYLSFIVVYIHMVGFTHNTFIIP